MITITIDIKLLENLIQGRFAGLYLDLQQIEHFIRILPHPLDRKFIHPQLLRCHLILLLSMHLLPFFINHKTFFNEGRRCFHDLFHFIVVRRIFQFQCKGFLIQKHIFILVGMLSQWLELLVLDVDLLFEAV